MTTAPKGLRSGGKALWSKVTVDHALDGMQLAMLEHACRQRDRADAFAVEAGRGDVSAARQERDSSMAMARLLAALRLPDARTGKVPIPRTLRGVKGPQVQSSGVSSLERARQRHSG